MQEVYEWPIKSDVARQYLLDVYDNKKWGTLVDSGYNKIFEIKFAKYNEIDYCATLSSGTAGLIASLIALNVCEGDEVIVPAMSFISTATCISMLKAIPVFVDITEETNCIDPEKVCCAITERTKAIIVVHIGGQVCNMDELLELSHKNNIPIVEDCAQAIGAEWKGKKVGTFGKIGVYSFAQTKNLVSGEGGAIITNDKDVISNVRRFRNHGRQNGMDYRHEYLGGNFRLTEFQAAVLVPQIDTLDTNLRKKNAFAKLLAIAISALGYKWLSTEKECNNVTLHGYYSFVFYYHKEKFGFIDKSVICSELKKMGVPVGNSNFTPGVINDNPIFLEKNRNYCHNIQYPTPVARKKYKEMIVLGQAVGSSIMLGGEKEIQFIVNMLIKLNARKEELEKKMEGSYYFERN